MGLKIFACSCSPGSAAARAALQFLPAGFVRQPSKLNVDLLGYYPLGEAGGADISGRGNHATAAIEATEFTQGVLCEQADVMDGRQYFELPFSLGDNLTVSIWARPAAAKLEQTVLSVGDDVRFGLSWMLEPIIWLNERKAEEAVIAGDALTADAWARLDYVRQGDEFRIYVDGAPVELTYEGETVTRAIADVATASGQATISRYRDGSGLHGAYQDVVIRAAALTGEEIAIEHKSYCEALLEVTA